MIQLGIVPHNKSEQDGVIFNYETVTNFSRNCLEAS
jgi:hypothetical protein